MVGTRIEHIEHIKRLHGHWALATERLAQWENLASNHAWEGTDPTTAKLILNSMNSSIQKVKEEGNSLGRAIRANGDYQTLRRKSLRLRSRYSQAESTIHFYTDALNTRTNPIVATMLRACDILAFRSMNRILDFSGKETPKVLCYLQNGIGAAILKKGLRLWDGSISPVAAIKITFHNLLRPTAIVHETGHQVAHMLNWNQELRQKLLYNLRKRNPEIAKVWASWASEIAADAYAFVHCGYGAAAALVNVVSGSMPSVFTFHHGDPHPISYVRAFLNLEMVRKYYGSGPWDNLEKQFKNDYPIDKIGAPEVPLIKECMKDIKEVVHICLEEPYSAFRNKSLTQIIDPMEVSPDALRKLDDFSSKALRLSHFWVHENCLDLLALTSYKIARAERKYQEKYLEQEQWMTLLGQNFKN